MSEPGAARGEPASAVSAREQAALARLNQLDGAAAAAALATCCGSARWVSAVLARRPFADAEALRSAARASFAALGERDWLEAFSHHPRIGDLDSLRKKFASTAAWASGEQAGARAADEATLRALQAGNDAYAEAMGFIFIVCATGKSAAEMLALLEARLPNPRAAELRNAAAEQEKITALRLDKLLRDLAGAP